MDYWNKEKNNFIKHISSLNKKKSFEKIFIFKFFLISNIKFKKNFPGIVALLVKDSTNIYSQWVIYFSRIN